MQWSIKGLCDSNSKGPCIWHERWLELQDLLSFTPLVGCLSREVEHATFTPLVFTTAGGASPLTSTFLKHLASRLHSREEGHGLQHNHWLASGPAQLQSVALSSVVHSRITIIGGPCTPWQHSRCRCCGVQTSDPWYNINGQICTLRSKEYSQDLWTNTPF